jgi:hypothetical protein
MLASTLQNHSTHNRPKPLIGNSLVLGDHRVAGRQHTMGHRCARMNQPLLQSQAVAGRSATILLTVDDQHRRIVQAVREVVREQGERAEQDRHRQQARMGQQQGGCHDRTVGEADRHGPSGKVVADAGCFDERRQFGRFGRNVSLVHPAIWKATEEGIPPLWQPNRECRALARSVPVRRPKA